LRSASLVVANSALTRRHLIELVDVNPSRVHTVYLGSEAGWNSPSEDERAATRHSMGYDKEKPLVLFVGAINFDSNKGLDVLWHAWNKLCARPEWDADLIVAGGGPAVAHWRAEFSRSPCAGRARLLGFTDQVRDILAAADLLVSPARYESFGLNVQEALCRGVPAIASANAGVAEIYPRELRNLLLPDPEDVESLVARMLLWRSNTAHWRDQAMEMSKTLSLYTWKHMAERFYNLALQHPVNLPAET
jgi:glycosyltransferase involved in cell wall biosynthesis